jgi:hypothetical protein
LHQDRDDLESPAAERHENSARPELPPAEVDLPLIARIDQICSCFRHPASRISLEFCLPYVCGYCETEEYSQTYDHRPR